MLAALLVLLTRRPRAVPPAARRHRVACSPRSASSSGCGSPTTARRGRSSCCRRGWASCSPAPRWPSPPARVLRLAAPWRAALGWAGLAGIVVACSMLDESVPWPGRAVLLPVLATMAVIVSGTAPMTVPWAPLARPAASRRCSGSAATRTPCTSGTGRLLVLAQAALGSAHVAGTDRAGRLSPWHCRPRRCASSRTRCATPATLSARPARLAGARRGAVRGHRRRRRADLRSSVGALDGGVTAAAPDLAAGAAVVAARHRPPRSPPPPTTIGSATTIATTGAIGRRRWPRPTRRAVDSPARGVDATGAAVVVGPGGGADQPRSVARCRPRPLGAVRRRLRERRRQPPPAAVRVRRDRTPPARSCCTATPTPCSGSSRCSRSPLAARLSARGPDQGRVPGRRRRRADAEPALHLPAVPRPGDRLDRRAPAGPRRGGELLHAVPRRRRRVGRRHRRDDRAARRRVDRTWW